MLVLLVLAFLFISNWLFCGLSIAIPFHLFAWLEHLIWLGSIALLLIIFSWFFGD